MSKLLPRALRAAACAIAVPAIVAVTAAPAAACGGLVGENGTIQLERTSTLAAYHDGVERYVTSFQFTGSGKAVGSIVPLPGVPTKVERGGSWTLQRLEREVQPPPSTRFFAHSASKASGAAQVLYQTKIDALDITILKGGGKEVGTWAVSHGFLLTPDAPEVLDFYSRRSPIFMAARFDASRAKALQQNSGDGTPIMLTIPTRDPWVPLRILGLGLDSNRLVNADVFLLTDEQPKLLAGGTGLTLERNRPAPIGLLSDLRSDKGMGWVPQQMWFTYLKLDAPAGALNYDLAISAHPHRVPSLTDTGIEASQAQPVIDHAGRALWPTVAAAITGIVAFGAVGLFNRRRMRTGSAV